MTWSQLDALQIPPFWKAWNTDLWLVSVEVSWDSPCNKDKDQRTTLGSSEPLLHKDLLPLRFNLKLEYTNMLYKLKLSRWYQREFVFLTISEMIRRFKLIWSAWTSQIAWFGYCGYLRSCAFVDTLNGFSSLQHASASRAFRIAADASRSLNLVKERMKTCDISCIAGVQKLFTYHVVFFEYIPTIPIYTCGSIKKRDLAANLAKSRGVWKDSCCQSLPNLDQQLTFSGKQQ